MIEFNSNKKELHICGPEVMLLAFMANWYALMFPLVSLAYPMQLIRRWSYMELCAMYDQIISATKNVDALGFGSGLVCLDAHPTETW